MSEKLILERFRFGLNLDDPWRYSGMKEPRSIIIPHLLKLELADGERVGKVEEAIARALGRHSSTAEQECLALANAMEKASIDFARCWFPWRYFTGSGNFPMDLLVRVLTERGKAIVPVIACGYSRMLPEGIDVDREPSRYIEQAGQHARELVRHYKQNVRVWQIENEPNWWEMHVAGGWRKGAAWLEKRFRYELLKMLNDSVHEEDGNAVTIINLEADRGISEVELKEYSSLCDYLGFDYYPNYKEAEPVDASAIRKADDMARLVGKNVIISETGYPSGPGWLGYTADKQAKYILSSCLNAFECMHVTAIGIWRYADTSWRSFPPQENHFGIFDELLNEKPAFRVYADTIAQLKGRSEFQHK
ncbi:MAG: hypothetical protein QXX17_05785 [Conexivisphaerales archaeon]